VPSLKRVFRESGAGAEWLFVYVREAHPGERLPAHETCEQKVQQARFFREAEDLPWPVLVDGLDGSVHRAYGGLPNPVFLIDAEGRVAFRGEFSHGPTLACALAHLHHQNDRGVVPEGDDKRPHMLGATAFGWEAIRRAGHQAVSDVVRGMPPLAANLWLGAHMRPLLAPLARRSAPLPRSVKLAVGIALIGGTIYAWQAARKRR
jgi:hypothetical protein